MMMKLIPATMRLVPATVAVALVACTGAHATPAASTAATCDVSKDGRKLGTTYVTSLTAAEVGCAKAKSLVKSFNKCRRAHGGANGRCASFSGFTCVETRKAIPTQFSAKVTCKASGGRRLKFAYTQFT